MLAALLAAGLSLMASAARAEKIEAGASQSDRDHVALLRRLRRGLLPRRTASISTSSSRRPRPASFEQLTAGSLDIVATTGTAEPIHAIDKGATNIAVARVVGLNSPYEIDAKPSVASIKDMKGKTMVLGGLVDITAIYWHRIAAANGLKPGDVDITTVGSTSRFAALDPGTVEHDHRGAAAVRFRRRGRRVESRPRLDYVEGTPFTNLVVSKPWASAHYGPRRAPARGARLMRAQPGSMCRAIATR